VRVLIVDDEAAARHRLHTMLHELDVEVVGEAANGVEALLMAAERSPDVVLLDIAMPEVDGFDVARHLREPRPLLIFQTAHDEYALRAFEHEALDYVMKPVILERLRQALERAARRLVARTQPPSAELLARIQAAVGNAGAVAKPRLLVREGTGHRLIALEEIGRFTAASGATQAHMGAARFGTDYTMAELEDRTRGRFVRASRAELVNIDHVQRFVRDPDGTALIVLRDGTRVPVSRRRATEVRQALEA
jgi:two-component system LytT family response regulator